MVCSGSPGTGIPQVRRERGRDIDRSDRPSDTELTTSLCRIFGKTKLGFVA